MSPSNKILSLAVVLLAFMLLIAVIAPWVGYVLLAIAIISFLYEEIVIGKVPTTSANRKRYNSTDFKADYNTYMASQSWIEKRKEVLARDNYTCQSCGSTDYLQVHHIHYFNFKNEQLNDLITLYDIKNKQ